MEIIGKIKKRNLNPECELTFPETIALLNKHIEYCNWMNDFYKDKHSKYRCSNFPEHISENIIRHIIQIKENEICIRNVKTGDLIKGTNDTKGTENIKVECKTFSSDGPSSFGPKEKWDEIYFLDAQNYLNQNFILYRIKLKHSDPIFLNIKVNKKDTFEKQALQGRRPRITFSELKVQLKDHVETIFQGNILELFTKETNPWY